MRDSVRAAGDDDSLLVVQTNNATFGYTAESEQQFAISRIRAIEHGRSVVHVSTVGVSGFVSPDGTVSEKTGLFTAEQRVGAPRRAHRAHPADRLGAAPEWLAAAALLRSCVGSTAGRRSVRVLEPVRSTPRGPTRCLRPPDRRCGASPSSSRRTTSGTPCPSSCGRLREVVPDVDVVVLDDNSPDGTGEVADALAAADPQVHVLHRAGKEGLGAAYLAGFQLGARARLRRRRRDGRRRLAPARAPARPARRAAETRTPSSAPAGSGAASVVNWPLHRKALSVGGNLYVKLLLGMPVNDATAGFRVYRADALRSHGPGRRRLAGLLLPDRPHLACGQGRTSPSSRCPSPSSSARSGDSKMSRDIMTESLRRITGWGVHHRARQVRAARRRLREPRWHAL